MAIVKVQGSKYGSYSGIPNTITKVQGNKRGSITSGTSISITMDSTPTSGNVIIVAYAALHISNYPSISSIVQTGVTWTGQGNPQVQMQDTNNGNQDAEIWIGIVGGSPSASLTINLAYDTPYGGIANVCEYSGIKLSGYKDVTATNDGSSAAPDTGTTGTTAQYNELWIGVLFAWGHAIANPSNGFTLYDGSLDAGGSASAMVEKISAAATGTADCTTDTGISTGAWLGAIVCFKAAIAGSPTIPITLDSTPVSGNILIACIGMGDDLVASAVTVSSITQTGVTWTHQIDSYYNVWMNQFQSTEIWYGVVGGGASKSIAIAISRMVDTAQGYNAAADVCEYSGMALTGFIDQTATWDGQSAGPVTGTTPTTTQASELWIGVIGCTQYLPSNPTNGFTLRDGALGCNYEVITYLEKIVSAIGTASSGVTLTGTDNCAACMATFKAYVIPVVYGYPPKARDFQCGGLVAAEYTEFRRPKAIE